MNKNLEIKLFSSLEKVFADKIPSGIEWHKGSMLGNEVYAFQVAYHWCGDIRKNVEVSVNSKLAPWITIRSVSLIASEMPCYANHDNNILRTTPGLYPDLLEPLDSAGTVLLPKQWRALWITIDTKGTTDAGMYPVEILFRDDVGETLGSAVFEIEIIKANLPKQKLVHTEWFHTDCLATYYGVDIFSEEHWERIEQFINTAVKHGMNMILTPIFTPPLDTEIGGERPTVQLVEVKKEGNTYTFNFDKLKRWVKICLSNGVEFFEFSHLFTQWGAKYAPKIMGFENGVYKRLFGWDTNALGEDYKAFLSSFLPELILFIKQNKLEENSYFHVSDEPTIENLEDYIKACEILDKFINGFPVIDALSDYSFYETGVVKNPIPSTDHITTFLDNQVPNLWTYYCCMQYKDVSNRFFNMPSARNRVLGMQLYKFNIKGFLHWGYNFWYSQFSRFSIDPFKVTDAAYGFASGDAFLVYPGKEGPLASLRLEVLYEALQDLRALELLEESIGKEAVLALIEGDLEQPLTFKNYPQEAEWILNKREQINVKIKAYI
ncbi:MAG: DUF4091 domain-containing protein [Cellulosilyticaceae bacterium]